MAISTTPPRLLDRFVGWVLDPDGVMYGDERERLRYYEASTFAASLQGLLVPWALAVTALVGGRPVAPYVLVLGGLVLLPWLAASLYVKGKRVRPAPERLTVTYVVIVILTALPYAILVVAAGTSLTGQSADDAHSTIVGAAVGGTFGAVIGILIRRQARVRAARTAAADDADLDA